MCERGLSGAVTNSSVVDIKYTRIKDPQFMPYPKWTAPVCNAAPQKAMQAPITIACFLPKKSVTTPAASAPMRAPPSKSDTINP